MMSLSEKEVSDLLKKLFTPTLLGLGLIGNLISIIIFSKASLIKHTTFKYLLLLSVLDLCVLITGCGSIFLEVFFGFNIRLINDYTCKIHSFMVIFFTHSSSMLLVCMSVDRVLVIKMKKGSKISNPKIASKVFWLLLLIIAVLNIHFLLFNHLITNEHRIDGEILFSRDLKTQINETSADLAHSNVFSSKNKSINRNILTDLSKNFASQFSDEIVFSMVNEDKLTNHTTAPLKFCYAADSFYYGYLTEIFPCNFMKLKLKSLIFNLVFPLMDYFRMNFKSDFKPFWCLKIELII
ncbi:FMRFamide receptor-like [Brachionus plicatilis]|uniref:FMRFamide receptor-like n=1 Tax=Brachionus plicatilis TaxID=10195 RepID=A0A3M7QIG5_BRAPC|nr:FMRFamide receptor-like [Brachionus plicatilis]